MFIIRLATFCDFMTVCVHCFYCYCCFSICFLNFNGLCLQFKMILPSNPMSFRMPQALTSLTVPLRNKRNNPCAGPIEDTYGTVKARIVQIASVSGLHATNII